MRLQLHQLTLLLVAGGAAAADDRAAVAGPEDKRYMLLGSWYGGATPSFVDAGVAAGFNSVRVTADWGAMETARGVINWSVLVRMYPSRRSSSFLRLFRY